jgi:hypothetical protein
VTLSVIRSFSYPVPSPLTRSPRQHSTRTNIPGQPKGRPNHNIPSKCKGRGLAPAQFSDLTDFHLFAPLVCPVLLCLLSLLTTTYPSLSSWVVFWELLGVVIVPQTLVSFVCCERSASSISLFPSFSLHSRSSIIFLCISFWIKEVYISGA